MHTERFAKQKPNPSTRRRLSLFIAALMAVGGATLLGANPALADEIADDPVVVVVEDTPAPEPAPEPQPDPQPDPDPEPAPGVVDPDPTSEADDELSGQDLTPNTDDPGPAEAVHLEPETLSPEDLAELGELGQTINPRGFSIEFEAGPVDPAASSLGTADFHYRGTGAWAYVYVMDADNNPIVGANVVFEVDQPAYFTNGNTCQTDGSGWCNVRFTSDQLGTVTLSAKVDAGSGVVSLTPVTTQYVPMAPCFASCWVIDPAKVSRVDVERDGAPADGATYNAVYVRLFDLYGYPAEPTTVHIMDGVAFMEVPNLSPSYFFGITEDGVAAVGFTSTVPGTYNLAAVIETTTSPVVLPFSVTFADVSRPVIESPSDGDIVGPSFLISGTGQPGWLVIVADEKGLTQSSGDVDEHGKWSTRLDLPTGNHLLTAWVYHYATNTIVTPSDPVSVVVTGAPDPLMSTVTVDKSTITAGQLFTATASVQDESGTPIPDVGVSFETTGSSTSSDSCMTGSDGKCSVGMTSLTAGSVTVTASIQFGKAPPVALGSQSLVTVNPGSVCVTGCTPVDGVSFTSAAVFKDGAAADGQAKNVVQVNLFDAYGNPTSGHVDLIDLSADWENMMDPQSPLQPMNFCQDIGPEGVVTVEFASTTAGVFPVRVVVLENLSSATDYLDDVHLTFVSVPVAPAITAPDDGAITNQQPLVVTGTGDVGLTVAVFSVRDVLGLTTVGENGTWSLGVVLPDGDHTLWAYQWAGGDVWSLEGATVSVTIDTVPPDAPRIDLLSPVEVSGGPGAAEPGGILTVLWPDGRTSTTVVNADGSWAVPTPADMISGDVGAFVTDAAGNVSEITDPPLDMGKLGKEPGDEADPESAGDTGRAAFARLPDDLVVMTGGAVVPVSREVIPAGALLVAALLVWTAFVRRRVARAA